ncbi:Hypothetical protein FKW44_006715 [Caligus rogercresseyi]|uniref:Uncharacterized protein n=1 Tax=Caligus rogercresseyi TaxID=217165 RepID=A0A7T8KDQ9_CALRO|nr:Hypothetical protein FKW44_006715 [Caligus rogercresseyi]
MASTEISTDGKGHTHNLRLCEEEEENPYHLIFDCPSTRQKIISLRREIGERR